MNRISAATVGYPFLFMLIAVSSLNSSGRMAVGILLLLITLVTLIVSRCFNLNINGVLCGLFAASMACFIFCAAEHEAKQGYVEGVEYRTHLVGTVVGEPYYNGRYEYVIESDDGMRVLLVMDSGHDGKLYDRFEGNVVMYLRKSSSSETHFYAYSENESTCTFKENESYILNMLASIRNFSCQRLDDVSKGSASEFLRGVMMGDETAISADLYQAFRLTGLSHVLVISGSHLTTVMLFVTTLFVVMRRKRRYYYIIAMLLMVAYMVMVGLGASVVRSGICCIAIGMGYILSRDSNSVNSLGVAALLTGIINPYTAVSLGFQLSFFSAFGIVTVGLCLVRKINRFRIPKTIKAFSKLIIITVTAQLFTLPILLPVYDELSILSVVANLLITFAVDLMVILALMYLLLSAVGLSPIALPFGHVAYVLAEYSVTVAERLSSYTMSLINIPQTAVAVTILAAVGVLVTHAVFGKRVRMYVAVMLSVCVIFATSATVCYNDFVRITVVSGNSFIIHHRKRAIIVGCGDYGYQTDKLIYYIQRLEPINVRLVIGKDNMSHSLMKVIDKTGVDAVMTTEAERLNEQCDDNISIFPSYSTLSVFDGCSVSDFGEYITISVNGVVITIAYECGTVPSNVNADLMMCLDKTDGSAKTAVVMKDTNPLALSADKVYNANSDNFTLVLSSNGSIISVR